MDINYYLDKFQKSIDPADQNLFSQKQLDLKVGICRNSVVLKIQKASWTNNTLTTKPFEESIFFSVWLSDESIKDDKLYYNIHALKLRELTGYSIKSRDFAEAFREQFKSYQYNWPNVSTQFGPLTLMEGWVNMEAENIEVVIRELAYKFLEVQYIIDDLLNERKK